MRNAAKRRVPYGNYDREPWKLKRGIRKVREDGLGAGWSNFEENDTLMYLAIVSLRFEFRPQRQHPLSCRL